jgi:hypothetical protein
MGEISDGPLQEVFQTFIYLAGFTMFPHLPAPI